MATEPRGAATSPKILRETNRQRAPIIGAYEDTLVKAGKWPLAGCAATPHYRILQDEQTPAGAAKP